MTRSRLRIGSSTNLPTIRSFGELDQFLGGSREDAESQSISDGMRQLAERVERIVATLRTTQQRTVVAPLLVDLLTVLRGHRNQVVHLGMPWRGLYEYGGYLQALTNCRVLVGQWLLDGGPRSASLVLTPEDFELVAWRTLAEGMLLIDMYEQWVASEIDAESGLADLQEPQVERAIRWWRKLRL
ncbi:MAG: hypothetical protein ACYC0T_03320 [Ramlibacter sp.]